MVLCPLKVLHGNSRDIVRHDLPDATSASLLLHLRVLSPATLDLWMCHALRCVLLTLYCHSLAQLVSILNDRKNDFRVLLLDI